MRDANIEYMLQFYRYWDSGDLDATVNCFAEDSIYDNVPKKEPLIGRNAIAAWLEMMFRMLDRIDSQILTIAANGEWVLCERLDDNITKDGKHFPLPVMNSTRIVDGKIKVFKDYYDRPSIEGLEKHLANS